MKQMKIVKGGGQVRKTSTAGSAQKTSEIKKSKKGNKPEMTADMVNLVLDKIREGNKDDAMTLLTAWSKSYNVNISEFFPKSQGPKSPEFGYKPIANAKVSKKSGSSHSRNNMDILTDTSLSESQRKAELKKANGWTDAQATQFLKKQVTGTPARGHLEIGDAADVIGWGRQNAYNEVAKVSKEEAKEYSMKIFGADFTK